MFPFAIRKVSLEHRGGTKEYHLVCIQSKDSKSGPSLLIKRWGKKGTWGQVQFIRGNAFEVEDEFTKIQRQKEGRGYDVTSENRNGAEDIDGLRKVLGPGYWRDMGKELPYLMPGKDPSAFKGARAAVEPRFDDDGNPTGAEPPKPKLIDDLPPPKTREELIESNPLWGSF